MTIFYKKFNMKNTSSSSSAHSIIYNLTIYERMIQWNTSRYKKNNSNTLMILRLHVAIAVNSISTIEGGLVSRDSILSL